MSCSHRTDHCMVVPDRVCLRSHTSMSCAHARATLSTRHRGRPSLDAGGVPNKPLPKVYLVNLEDAAVAMRMFTALRLLDGGDAITHKNAATVETPRVAGDEAAGTVDLLSA